MSYQVWDAEAAARAAASATITPVSVTFDAASVAAAGTSDQTVTVAGATTDCGVLVTPPSGIASGLTWSAWGSATNNLTIRFNNPTAGAIDLSSGTWKFRIVK
jgi:hypothetical protein